MLIVPLFGLSVPVAAQDGRVPGGAVHSDGSRTMHYEQSASYRSVEVTDGALLRGRVTFTGEAPEPRRLLITKDVEVCGEGYRERHDVVVADGDGLQNAVVIIDGIEEGKAWPDAGQSHVLNQKNCVFLPHVQVVPRGAELSIVNSDPVLHNIHSYELIGRAMRTLFNFGQPPEKGTITQVLRPRRGNRIRIECDAHDFMLGWIYAAETPYYAVVSADGSFEIGDIPAGTYTVRAWHPFLGNQEQQVTLAPGQTSDITFQFSGR